MSVDGECQLSLTPNAPPPIFTIGCLKLGAKSSLKITTDTSAQTSRRSIASFTCIVGHFSNVIVNGKSVTSSKNCDVSPHYLEYLPQTLFLVTATCATPESTVAFCLVLLGGILVALL